MKTAAFGFTTVGLAVLLGNVAAWGQVDRSDADALRSSVLEVLSLTAFGTVKVQDQAAQVTRDGSEFRLRLPLVGFLSPPDAAVEADAHPLRGGIWEIGRMAFPSTGTVVTGAPNGTGRITYTISEQTIHARIDPGFVQPSSFAAKLTGVSLRFEQKASHSDQTLDQYSVDGAISGETAGRVTFASASKGANWHMMSRGPDGVDRSLTTQAMTGRLSLEDLDRVQGNRLLTASRALAASMQQTTADVAAGFPSDNVTARRLALRQMVDAFVGLLTRFKTDQTFDDISFAFGPAAQGTMRDLHLNMLGSAIDEHVSAQMEVAVDGLALASLSAPSAAYVPRHVNMKPVLAGVRTSELLALLRAATAADADPTALQGQLMRLLDEPGARLGIDAVSFDSGPMRVTGSARVVPQPGGHASAAIHLSATGVDELLAQAQGVPALRVALPVMLMAKGMGRVEGEAMVWDISLGNGALTINGMPLRQAPSTR